MQIVDPCVPLHLVPAGSKAHVVNGPNDEYQDLPSIITPYGQVITRWALTEEERARLLAGDDLYLTIWARTGLQNGRMTALINPVYLSVGVLDWSKR